MVKIVVLAVVVLICIISRSRGIQLNKADADVSYVGQLESVHLRMRRDDSDVPRDIVGGKNTSIYVYKHQVAIIGRSQNEDLRCGGSIINSKWILTAAHCCVNVRPSRISLRAGSTFYYAGGDLYYVSKIIYHKNYNQATTDYDVCVLKTTKPIKFGNKVQPITMINEGQTINEDSIATVSGWGKLQDSLNAQASLVLQDVKIPVVGQKKCREKYAAARKSEYITDRQLCAGARTGGKDSCQGDSGGPMVVNGKLAGVTSWGIGCGEAQYPGVYSNVAFFRSWIQRLTGT